MTSLNLISTRTRERTGRHAPGPSRKKARGLGRTADLVVDLVEDLIADLVVDLITEGGKLLTDR